MIDRDKIGDEISDRVSLAARAMDRALAEYKTDQAGWRPGGEVGLLAEAGNAIHHEEKLRVLRALDRIAQDTKSTDAAVFLRLLKECADALLPKYPSTERRHVLAEATFEVRRRAAAAAVADVLRNVLPLFLPVPEEAPQPLVVTSYWEREAAPF